MKKITLLCLMPILLAGCGKTPDSSTSTEAYKKWKYLCPIEAPAVAMAEFAQFSGFETTTQPGNIPSLMAAANPKYDVVVAPTNVGVNAIKGGAPYKILCTITFGNFYIASTGKDSDGMMDADDYVVAFQKPGVPGKVLKYLYGATMLNSIDYFGTSSSAIRSCLETGVNAFDGNKDVDYVVLAEPSLTSALKLNSNAFIYEDLQSKYNMKSDGLILTQASVFVKNSLNKDDVKKVFMPKLKSSIEGYVKDSKTLKSAMNNADDPETTFGTEVSLAVEVTKKGNKMGFGFEESAKIIDDLNKFLTIMEAPTITNEDIA